MSYSYVKTVFPNFQYSNLYNSNIYDNLNVSKDKKIFEAADFNTNSQFSDLSVFEEEKPSKSKIETFQDNQQFFNQPLPKDNIPVNNNKIYSERFEQPQRQENSDHLEYTKHVLECSKCKELLMKQFGLENERIRNEEIMELISFIIFGLFILLLIDAYAKK